MSIPTSPQVVLKLDNPDGSGSMIVTRAWVGTLTVTNSFPLTSVRVQNTSDQPLAAIVSVDGVPTLSGSVAAGFDQTFTSLGGATTSTSLGLESTVWG